MSSPSSSDQQLAARSLIAQMVANSDVRGEDAAEIARLQAGADGENQDQGDEEQDRQQLQQYDDDAGGRAVDAYSDNSHHKDQVQAAFENFGQISEEILSEWKEMFSLFESVHGACDTQHLRM
jgi:hypothetical protein